MCAIGTDAGGGRITITAIRPATTPGDRAGWVTADSGGRRRRPVNQNDPLRFLEGSAAPNRAAANDDFPSVGKSSEARIDSSWCAPPSRHLPPALSAGRKFPTLRAEGLSSSATYLLPPGLICSPRPGPNRSL